MLGSWAICFAQRGLHVFGLLGFAPVAKRTRQSGTGFSFPFPAPKLLLTANPDRSTFSHFFNRLVLLRGPLVPGRGTKESRPFWEVDRAVHLRNSFFSQCKGLQVSNKRLTCPEPSFRPGAPSQVIAVFEVSDPRAQNSWYLMVVVGKHSAFLLLVV